jgi:hypothetical protein
MTAGFLQAKGPASVVVVATATGGSALFVGATAASGSTTVISPSNASGGVLPVLANVSVAPDGQLALLDIDGDGQNDLVLLTGTAPTTGFCTHFAQMTRSLLVFWNNNGTFDVNHPSTVATCNVDCANAAVGTFTGQTCPGPFATLHTGTGAAPTLAYVAATEPASSEVTTVAFVHTGGPGNHVFSPPTTPSLMRVGADGGVVGDGGALLPSTVKIDAIASGDINGDGVDDLAILAKGILYLFQGVPVQP